MTELEQRAADYAAAWPAAKEEAIRLNADGLRLGDIAEAVETPLDIVREWVVTEPLRERRPERGTEA